MTAPRELRVYRLGQVEYEDGLRLQELFGQARARGLVPDTLLLLEHPPVLTLGRAAKRENITTPPEVLARMGVEVHETTRGGDVTYHGPGQIVGYPIFLLSPDRQDVRRYVRSVEEGLIRALARFGIEAGRIDGWAGVWLGRKGEPDARKIGAIGVHLSRWLTSHGFALNVRTNLAHFGLIVPCGIKEAGVTSMALELPQAPELPQVEQALAESFADVFGATLSFGGYDMRTVGVAVIRGRGEDTRALVLRRQPMQGGFWQIITGEMEPGESPAACAAREVFEETGCRLHVEDLGYRNSFALGESLPPRVVEAHGFVARWEEGGEVRLAPEEHDAHEWLPIPEALERMPFKGLRETLRRAAAHAGWGRGTA
ncbi:MAG TPA: lipoyl(octanoyl) transferase LipB [Longimicrobium sp.]|nr:lipoyl(octanoyl) transferase LipB [Longimicrobium sp.]